MYSRTNRPEFDSSVVDFQMPFDAALFEIGGFCPGRGFGTQFDLTADAAAGDALASQPAQFVCRDVQPAPVPRRVVEFEAADIARARVGSNAFAERAHSVFAQIVADHNHFLTSSVAGFRQRAHFDGPIAFRTTCSDTNLLPASHGSREHEHVCESRVFVFVVDSLRMVLCSRDRLSGFCNQLSRLIVNAKRRHLRVIRLRTNIQHVVPVRREIGIRLRRNGPISNIPLSAILFFFSVRSTVR